MKKKEMGQPIREGYLANRWTAMAQASLRIRAVSPEPLLTQYRELEASDKEPHFWL